MKVWMKKSVLFAAMLAVMASVGLRLAGQTASAPHAPVFSADNRLTKPENYREWIWLSSGFGMAYGPSAQATTNADPPFDNVFVTPEAYRAFLQTGQWPDKTTFVLEVRASVGKGSINQQGHYQGKMNGMEVEVKDNRFPGKWAFFDFSSGEASAAPLPATATCYSCHSQNGAVDNTFVQFYPTLLDVATQKGTLKNPREAVSNAAEHPFRGRVENVDTKAKALTVNGENVPGWMAAMTMTYGVDSGDVLAQVKIGDQITATVRDGDLRTLYDVRVVAPKGDASRK